MYASGAANPQILSLCVEVSNHSKEMNNLVRSKEVKCWDRRSKKVNNSHCLDNWNCSIELNDQA